jgi:hypothetical protein
MKPENVATDSPPGTVIDMESYRTSSAVDAEAPTSPRIASGPATGAIAPCDIKAFSGLISEGERWTIARIRRNRNQGWMATFEEFDFLLSIAERVCR